VSGAMPETGQASLAYETHGEGVPVVFLHGLTFDRRTWRPIIERLRGGVRSIAIDLPGHGETGGPGCGLDEAAARINATLRGIDVDAPIIVGHSMSGGIAMMYAAAYPVRGVVDVDQTMNMRPFAELVQRLEPALRGNGFASVFNTFQASMGLDNLSEPLRSMVLETQSINQEIVLQYWDEVLRSDPLELQGRVQGILQAVEVPCLCVFGQVLPADDREDLQCLRDIQLEEWPDRGHFVHLAEPDRFSARLHAFVAHCTESPRQAHPAGPDGTH
jgi:pimeloyl-ACP methyl ester carboxylesterase